MKDETADDLAAFGAPAEIIGLGTEPDDLEIWPENVEVVMLFLRLQTQWVVGGMGGAIGLNYQSVAVVMDILGIEGKAAALDGLQVMERAALAVINARKD